MSMSNLSSQLAALQHTSSTVAAGQIRSSTHKHEDAIGRGVGHSVDLGYTSAISSGNATKFRATVLYGDTKAAADVPVSTLHTNAVQALEELYTQTSDPCF
eukprot:CAMPEP_0194371178 /NCGR_PEP_ID=MMETSP0174-20130528/19568_1 /TAXON_ID=216777 /ORGANISM="Proboscia alata, Strain PI-D3" /LENGTH=100 /DNA_ID=CAMNT_0039149083 /DNA_START=91 /DNA_END=390 /DNA_ORIENTATION=+